MKNEEIILNPNVLKMLQGPITEFYKKILTKDFVNNTVEIKNYQQRFNPKYEFFDFLDVRRARRKYMENEHNWYMSLDRSIIGHQGIEGNKIWEKVCSKDGKKQVNSQYGWIVFSKENGANGKSQFDNCLENLLANEFSRQGVIEYMRPSIWEEWNENGKHDFICTFCTICVIRGNKLHYTVYMRSNSLFTGFVNDFHWHCFVMNKMLDELNKKGMNLTLGSIYWSAASFHAYEEDYDDIINIYNKYKLLLKQKQYYIYKISNLFDDKVYIGKHYGSILDNYMGSGILINRAIKFHGINEFNKEIIEICDQYNIDQKEKYWIKKENAFYPNGYNIDSGGSGGDRITHNPRHNEICKNIGNGIRKRNLENPDICKNQGKKISGKNNPMFGKKDHTYGLVNNTKLNIGKTFEEIYGKDRALLIKQKLSNANKGKIVSEETKQKLKIINSGKNNPMYKIVDKQIQDKILLEYKNTDIANLIAKNLSLPLYTVKKVLKEHNLDFKCIRGITIKGENNGRYKHKN